MAAFVLSVIVNEYLFGQVRRFLCNGDTNPPTLHLWDICNIHVPRIVSHISVLHVRLSRVPTANPKGTKLG